MFCQLAGVDEGPRDEVGEVAEAEGGTAEVFEAAVDGFDGVRYPVNPSIVTTRIRSRKALSRAPSQSVNAAFPEGGNHVRQPGRAGTVDDRIGVRSMSSGDHRPDSFPRNAMRKVQKSLLG